MSRMRVNSSWGGFTRLRLDHMGIIATIGISMILVALIAHWKWWQRALVAAGCFFVHPAPATNNSSASGRIVCWSPTTSNEMTST